MYAKLEYYKYLICKASEIFMRKKFAWLLVFCLIFSSPAVCLRAVGGTPADVETKSHETTDHPPDLGLTSKACILMEASTGNVIYAQNPDERLSPASITKIMTLILIFEALNEGKISLADEVVTSAYAKSMGGSQVFLRKGRSRPLKH